PVQANVSQPTLARSPAAGESPTSRMPFPGRVEIADGQETSMGRSSGPAVAANPRDVAATQAGSAASRSDVGAARKGGPTSSSDATTARSDLSASPRSPNAARTSHHASAWRVLGKPARARQLLLGVAVVVVALVVVGTLFKATSPDKGAGFSKSNGPALAAHQEASATSESGRLQ